MYERELIAGKRAKEKEWKEGSEIYATEGRRRMQVMQKYDKSHFGFLPRHEWRGTREFGWMKGSFRKRAPEPCFKTKLFHRWLRSGSMLASKIHEEAGKKHY